MAGRPALISARFDGGEVEKRMREACRILKSRNCNVLMVEVAPGDDFGTLTAIYLNRVRKQGGALLAVCTENYAEVTSSKFSSHQELLYAFTYGIDIIPLKMAATYPPQPAYGEAHPYDKEGVGEAVISMAMPPSLLYEDCASSNPKQIADKIEARLGRPSVAPSALRATLDSTLARFRTPKSISKLVGDHVSIFYADGGQFWDDVSSALENPKIKTVLVWNAEKALLADAKIELFMRDNGFDIDAIRGTIARRQAGKSPKWDHCIVAGVGAAAGVGGVAAVVAAGTCPPAFGCGAGALAAAGTCGAVVVGGQVARPAAVAAERYVLTAALEGKGSFTLEFKVKEGTVFESGEVSATLSINGSRGKA